MKKTFLFICISSTFLFCFSYKTNLTHLNPLKAYFATPELKLPGESQEGETTEERQEWEERRLADPATGEIPQGIRAKEMKFAERMSIASNTGFRNGDWKSRGPWNVGGRTRAFAIDKNNEKHLFAGGVSGGVWESWTSGNTWQRVTPMNYHPGVVSIAQDTRLGKTDTWYALSGEMTGTSASGGSAFYIGDGLFKSLDNGKTWNPVAATAAGTPNSFANLYQSGWRVVTDANSTEDVVYMATIGTVYRSANGGTSWKAVLGGSTAAYSYYADVAISPKSVLYATMSSEGPKKGIWRSADGLAWVNILPTDFPKVYDRFVVGINPNNENEVYFLGATPGSGFKSFYISADNYTSLWKYTYVSGDGTGAGGTWQGLSNNLPSEGTQFDRFANQGGYDLVVKMQPGTNNLFIGGTNIYRSTDGFTSNKNTTHIGGYKPGTELPYFEIYPNHHPDQHDLCFSPSNPNVLYSLSDGGVRKTDNCLAPTVEWTSLNNGYITSQFYTVFMEKTIADDPMLIGGLQDNGNFFINSTNTQDEWTQTVNGDGAYGAIADGKSAYYLSIQQGKMAKVNLDDKGKVLGYTRIDPIGAKDYQFINPFVLDPVNQNIMYVAAGHQLWRNDSLNHLPLNNQWDSIKTGWFAYPDTVVGAATVSISAVAVAKSPAHRVYFGTSNNKLYRIDDADGPNYKFKKLINPSGSAYVSCITVDPYNGDDVTVVYSNYNVYSLYNSKDGGTTWKRVGGNVELNIGGSGDAPSLRWMSILPLPDGSKKYFLGTSIGLYSADSLVVHTSTTAGTQWKREADNLIGYSVVNMIDTRAVDGLVVVATHGQGIISANFKPIVAEKNLDFSPYLSLSPNPTNDFTYLDLSSFEKTNQPFQIKIFDLVGRLVHTFTTTSNEKYYMDTRDWQKGTYLVSVQQGEKRGVKKLVVY
ncbi:MAG: hypothetical protein RLZZ292_1265 [Bacteroidota bacterium]|jgi:photosystem II stability/assembly factor-like uncharacterized protein